MSSYEEFVELYKTLNIPEPIEFAYAAFDLYVRYGLRTEIPRKRIKKFPAHNTEPTPLGLLGYLPGDVRRILYEDNYLAGKMSCLSKAYNKETSITVRKWQYSPIIGADMVYLMKCILNALTIEWPTPGRAEDMPDEDHQKNALVFEEVVDSLKSITNAENVEEDQFGTDYIHIDFDFITLLPLRTPKPGIEGLNSLIVGYLNISCRRGEQLCIKHRGASSNNSDLVNGINWWIIVTYLTKLCREELVVPWALSTHILTRRFNNNPTIIEDYPTNVECATSIMIRRWCNQFARGLYCTVEELLGVKLLSSTTNNGFVIDPVEWTTEELRLHKRMVIRHYVNYNSKRTTGWFTPEGKKRLTDLADWLDSDGIHNNKKPPFPTHYTSIQDVDTILDNLARTILILGVRRAEKSYTAYCLQVYEKAETTFLKLMHIERLFGTLMRYFGDVGRDRCTTSTGKKLALVSLNKRYNITSVACISDDATWIYPDTN